MSESLRHRVFLLLIFALALGLRLAFLDQESFWLDESTTSYLARHPLPDLLSGYVHEIGYPGGQLILAHLWISVFGTTDFAMRTFPVMLGMLGLVLFYGCAREVLGARAALLAALLLAINPGHILLSQEFRMYTALFASASGAIWSAVAYWRRGSWLALLGFIVSAAGGMQMHYYAALPAIALALYGLLTLGKGPARTKWVLACGAIALLALTLLAGLLADLGGGPRPRPGVSEALHFLLVPLCTLFGRSLAWRNDGVPLFGAAILLAFALWALVLRAGWRTLPQRGPLLIAVLLPAGIAAVLVFGAHMLAWDDRKALVIMPPLLLLLTHGVRSMSPRLQAVVIALLVSGSAVSYARYIVGTQRDDWRAIAAALDAQMQPGEQVLVAPDEEVRSLRRYLRSSAPQARHGDPIVGWTLDENKFIEYLPTDSEMHDRPPLALRRTQRIWLVLDQRRTSPVELLPVLAAHGLRLEAEAAPMRFARDDTVTPYRVVAVDARASR